MRSNLLFIALCFSVLSACSSYESDHVMNEAYNYPSPEQGGDQYNDYEDNPFVDVTAQAVSTFSVDADGGSYANVRRFIEQDYRLPVTGAVRTEELLNYFDLDYPYTDYTHPIAVNGEVAACPWNTTNKLIRIGIKGSPVPNNQRPPANFVFLIDVSGSMSSPDKLGFLKAGFNQFVDGLSSGDKISIVTYAGAHQVLLSGGSGADKQIIKEAINQLGSDGGTAGAAGINTAYSIALQHFIPNGNNRIILGTDGDFNVGVSNTDDLLALIKEKRASNVFLTVLGVGRGNYNEGMLEQLANKGNGTYEYIDKEAQLTKIFIHDYNKFYTVAKDVKVQVEFNPNIVAQYRLIGYENRMLTQAQFEADSTDAGEIGASQSITALYEITPVAQVNFRTNPTFTIDFKYKKPSETVSNALTVDIYDQGHDFSQSSDCLKFTAGVAGFGMLLRDSPYKGSTTYSEVQSWVNQANLADPYGYKADFSNLVQRASNL